MMSGCCLLVVPLLAAVLVCAQSMLVEQCQPSNPHSYCNGNLCAPDDRLVGGNSGDVCRTNIRFSHQHDLPSTWVLMFDSYDYQTLVGPALLSREFDSDGDVSVKFNLILVISLIVFSHRETSGRIKEVSVSII